MRPQRQLRYRRACVVLAAIGSIVITSLGLPFGALAANGGVAAPAPLIGAGIATTPLTQPGLPQPTKLTAATPQTRVHTIVSVHRPVLNTLDGHAITVNGVLRPGLEGRVLSLQVLNDRRWRVVAHARTGAHGRFRLRYVPRGTVSERVRVRFGGDPVDGAAQRAVGRLNVYRLAGASWYGGGGGLACGGSLTSSTMGVANKTLPCGTLVTLRYNGRTVRVPVVDRGPYVAGRDFDLTEATKRALGFGDTGQIWSTR